MAYHHFLVYLKLKCILDYKNNSIFVSVYCINNYVKITMIFLVKVIPFNQEEILQHLTEIQVIV